MLPDLRSPSAKSDTRRPRVDGPAARRIQPQHLVATVQLLQRAGSASHDAAAAQHLVEALASTSPGAYAVVAARRRGGCRIIASSQAAPAQSDEILGVAEETIIRNEAASLDRTNSNISAGKPLVADGDQAIWARPLRDDQGEPIGAVVVLSPTRSATPDVWEYFVAKVEPVLARFRVAAARNRFARANAWLAGRRGLLSCALVCGLAAVLFTPAPQQIRCECRVEPRTRRFIAAPFDVQLKKTLVASGDIVARGQPLAMLDDRDLQSELSSVDARVEWAKKERDVALARGKTADAQQASLEAAKASAERERLRLRLRNLTIRSPLEGVVIESALEHAEGAPLATGQQLFEVAPLDRVVVEVAIPESEAARVHPGMAVAVKLASFSGRIWRGTVVRLRPRAELRADASVFVAVVELPNADGELRPGMEGRATVTGARHLRIWNWLHGPWETARARLGW
ncbi:MAG: efflux RND transporter periplasmic adaptor subunit [Pirellulaceae bacterium]|jgi:RND family efflux transporter MFP subunit|nr:efflux RND transporter periplasmic adaptor subunit [Pirellulaceae bacterium]MDP7014799.1 efflux RND transporter periplasmic adaptor subunit [Pirellulaceae bacterium]